MGQTITATSVSRLRGPTVVGLLSLLLGHEIALGADKHARSVAVGISDYRADVYTTPLPFADKDAELFDTRIARAFFAQRVLLNRPGDGQFTTQWALNKALAQALPGDTVYIFISSRGIARPGSSEGYIGTSDLVTQKPESTAVPVSYIRQLIEHSAAARVVLFADVCREPPAGRRFVNQINYVLGDLGKTRKPEVAGILASGAGEISMESPALQHGVFGYQLVEAASRDSASLRRLFNGLSSAVSQSTNGRQNPSALGKDDVSLWSTASTESRYFGEKSPVFVAAVRFWPLLLLAQSQDTRSRLRVIRETLAGRDEVRDPKALAQEILDMRDQSPEWEETRDLAISRLADTGQAIVARYGMQDALPDDPLRVSETEFHDAADAFESASQLLPSGAGYSDLAAMLDVRKLLCRAQQNTAPDRDLLLKANAMTRTTAEVANTLGISYMTSRETQKAISYFQSACKQSPDWLYPRHNLALAHLEQGDYRGAEQVYREALAAGMPQPYLHYNYGLLLQRLNRTKEAKAEYERAIASYDQTIELLEDRARQWRSTSPRNSEMAARRAVIFRKNKAEVFNAWATLLEARGDWKGAAKLYESARGLNPQLWPVLYNEAKLDQKLAERSDRNAVSSQAISLLETSLPAQPGTPARLLLGELYRKSGEMVKARVQLREVFEKEPDNTEAAIELAALDRKIGDPSTAANVLERSIALQKEQRLHESDARRRIPDQALLLDLAEVYGAMGRAQACREQFGFALSAARVQPNSLGAREIQKRATLCGR